MEGYGGGGGGGDSISERAGEVERQRKHRTTEGGEAKKEMERKEKPQAKLLRFQGRR